MAHFYMQICELLLKVRQPEKIKLKKRSFYANVFEATQQY